MGWLRDTFLSLNPFLRLLMITVVDKSNSHGRRLDIQAIFQAVVGVDCTIAVMWQIGAVTPFG